MTLTLEHGADRVTMNQQDKYLEQRWFNSKVIDRTHRQTDRQTDTSTHARTHAHT